MQRRRGFDRQHNEHIDKCLMRDSDTPTRLTSPSGPSRLAINGVASREKLLLVVAVQYHCCCKKYCANTRLCMSGVVQQLQTHLATYNNHKRTWLPPTLTIRIHVITTESLVTMMFGGCVYFRESFLLVKILVIFSAILHNIFSVDGSILNLLVACKVFTLLQYFIINQQIGSVLRLIGSVLSMYNLYYSK